MHICFGKSTSSGARVMLAVFCLEYVHSSDDFTHVDKSVEIAL